MSLDFAVWKSTSKAVASPAPLVSHFLISLDSLGHTWPGSAGLCGKPLAALERGVLTARSLAWSTGFHVVSHPQMVSPRILYGASELQKEAKKHNVVTALKIIDICSLRISFTYTH